jgi:holo-[acyl-carrier protein] synthase
MSEPAREDDAAEREGVVASAVEVVGLDEVEALLAKGAFAVWSEGELGFARARADPERRLAARLCAKRAAVRALGGDVTLQDVEVVRGAYGPPRLRLSARGEARLAALGAARALVSLTHERRHAAALVLLVRDWR